MKPSTAIIALIVSLFVQNASAQEITDHPSSPNCTIPSISERPNLAGTLNTSDSPQNILSDRLIQPSREKYIFEGNVVATQLGQQISGQRLEINQTSGIAKIENDVSIHLPDLSLTASEAELDNSAQTIDLKNTRYQSFPSLAYGEADRIKLNKVKNRATLNQATWTTCTQDKEATKDWQLKFATAMVDKTEQRFYAKHARLYIGSIPVFYTPYLSLSLKDRESGFLFPELGSYKTFKTGQTTQYTLLPYFVDLGPNKDITINPYITHDNGIIFDSEARYLQSNSTLDQRSTLLLSAYHDNKAESDGINILDGSGNITNIGSDAFRWRAHLHSQLNWKNGLSANINWQTISDISFYNDTPVAMDYQSQTQIPRSVRINWQQPGLSSYLLVNDVLSLRENLYNYSKAPEIGVHFSPKLLNISNLNTHISTTATAFRSSDQNAVEANRVLIKPSISYTKELDYGFWSANALYQTNQYQNHESDSFADTSIAIPQMALKGGLIFERFSSVNGFNFQQTLEPVVQLTYVPYKDQSHIPLFDSGLRSLDFNNLFALNRFVGSDRIGDTKQLSYALSSRFFDEQGRHLADLGMGQVIYLEDQKVTLSTEQATEQGRSDIFLKGNLYFDTLSLFNTSKYSQQQQKLADSLTRAMWNPSTHQTWFMHHTWSKNLSVETNTLALGTYQNFSSQWQLGAYARYDVEDKNIEDMEAKIRYQSCCWALQFGAKRSFVAQDLYNNSFTINFELSGLSSNQNSIKQRLANDFNF